MKQVLLAATGAAALIVSACSGGNPSAAPTAAKPAAAVATSAPAAGATSAPAAGATSAAAPSLATASAPTAAAAAAAVAVPAAPVVTSGRKEVALVAVPRKRLEETLQAVQRGDFAAARTALDQYDGEWNGVEVYVNFRSRALYGEIESHYQADINEALSKAQPGAAELTSLLQAMIGQYDEAIKLSDSGAPLHPLFDDVATVRTVRAPLRRVSPALKGGDTVRATTNFGAFKAGWPEAKPLIAARSADMVQQIQGALDAADRSLSASTLNAAEAGPLVDALMDRYNVGVNMLNAAARNADVARTAFAPEDVQAAARIGAVERDLRASLTALDGGDRAAASAAAQRAAGPRFEAVATALQAKAGADVALKKALDAYTAALEQAGEVAGQRTSGRAAVDAALVGGQALVGQFWTEPAFQTAYLAALAGL
jgi:hypothetical protein